MCTCSGEELSSAEVIAAHRMEGVGDDAYAAPSSFGSNHEPPPTAEWLKIGHLAVFAQSLYLDPDIRPSLGDILVNEVFCSPSTLRLVGDDQRADLRIPSYMVKEDARLRGLSFVVATTT
jgi:hypothetical protein